MTGALSRLRLWTSRISARPVPPPTSLVLSYLASYLRAGLSAPTAWRELAREFPDDPVPASVVAGLDEGVAVHQAVLDATAEAPRAWQLVGVVWSISRETGAPRAPMCEALGLALGDTEATTRSIQSAAATPRATLRLIAALPLVAVVASGLAGVEGGFWVLTTPVGLVIGAVAAAMMVGAWWWVRLAIERVTEATSGLSLELDVFAAALAGGLTPQRARAAVAEAFDARGVVSADARQIEALVGLSRRAGVPVASLATLTGSLERSRARLAADEAVARLQVTLVLPMGLLVLPAFVLVAVAPVVAGMGSPAWG